MESGKPEDEKVLSEQAEDGAVYLKTDTGIMPEELENQRLKEENDRLREELERVRSLPMKERIYDRIHVSLRTLDIFIGVMIALGIIVTIIGILK